MKPLHKKYARGIVKMQDEHGGALVEFAIVMPLLLLLLGGIVDFGVLLHNKQVLTNASREGARAGIVFQKDAGGSKLIIQESEIQDIVEAYCVDQDGKFQGLWTFGGSSMPTTTATGVESLSYPSDLTVTVTYEHSFLLSSLIKAFGGNLGPTLEISASTVMRME